MSMVQAEAVRQTTIASAREVLDNIYDALMSRAPAISTLGELVLEGCAIRLTDMVEHVVAPLDTELCGSLGWSRSDQSVWRHKDGLPDLTAGNASAIVFRTQTLDRLAEIADLDMQPEYVPFAPNRFALLASESGVHFKFVERCGSPGPQMDAVDARLTRRGRLHLQEFRVRRRHFRSASAGLSYAERLIDAAIGDLGADWACDLFMRAEREYWTRRCDAGAVMARLQEQCGFGFSNVDAHVYETSRDHLSAVLRIFGKLGYTVDACVQEDKATAPCRSMLVLYQPMLRLRILVDVDLAADEALGTVRAPTPAIFAGAAAFWCALHGESLLEGGMSGVIARYDCEGLLAKLLANGLRDLHVSSDPISYVLALGADRPVDRRRIKALASAGYIDNMRAERLLLLGARATLLLGYDARQFTLGAPERLIKALWTAIAPPPRPSFRRPGRRRQQSAVALADG
jgi:hypothetical protein